LQEVLTIAGAGTMIGTVLVTHGNLARGFLATIVCIGAADDMQQRREEILEKCAHATTATA
jgi:mannose/fructose-specific phosphotransferase system component IIA